MNAGIPPSSTGTQPIWSQRCLTTRSSLRWDFTAESHFIPSAPWTGQAGWVSREAGIRAPFLSHSIGG